MIHAAPFCAHSNIESNFDTHEESIKLTRIKHYKRYHIASLYIYIGRIIPTLYKLKLFFYLQVLQVVFLSYLRSVTMKSFISIVLSCEKCSSFEQ